VFSGPVFVHGFVRNYANLLGLDPGKLIEAADRSLKPLVKAENAVDGAVKPDESSQKSVVPLFLIAAILIVGVLGWMLSRESPLQQVSSPAQESANSSPQAVESKDESVALTEPGADVPAPDSAATARPVAQPAEVEPGVVRFVFDEESWVEVTDRNGEVVFSVLGAPGTARTVSGQPPLAVIVGNTKGVTLTYNDQVVDLAPYTRADVARLTLK